VRKLRDRMGEEEYKKIDDESINGFENVMDKGLVNYDSSDVRNGDRVVAEMMRRLNVSIKKFNMNSAIQSKRIFWLTVVMAVIAIFQLMLLVLKKL